MKLIKKLLEESQKENMREGNSFLTEQSKQKLREQWVLGKFTERYNEKTQHKLIYAEILKNPEKNSKNIPDFKIFDFERNYMFDIEITEALDAERKRNLEYRTTGKGVKEIPEVDYLPVIQRLISQKSSKNYPIATLLIIYLDVFSSIYDEFESKTFSSLSLTEKCNLLQIWLLDSGGDKILQIS